MKKLVFVLAAFFVANFAFAQTAEKQNGPAINFQETSYDFGDITQGDVVEHVFKFENTGNEPLILSNVQTTCGCTAPSWPREPIAPGASADLTVKFSSAGKMGNVTKVITIVSNAGATTTVKIQTNILPKES
jgi:hypothetical protein